MINEKNTTAISGYLSFVVLLAGLGLAAYGIYGQSVWLIAIGIVLALVILKGWLVVNPNESAVLILFGSYQGTVRKDGFFWVNPLVVKRTVSLKARNLDGQKIKVNDKLGNPIEIAAVVVWQVRDTAKALFAVDDYSKYVQIQSEAAVRHLANQFAYDNFEDEAAVISLKDGAQQVSGILEKELNDRLAMAGIDVIEARITHLAYAPEIASAMLQRQQATAVVSARRQIVDGAVGMVEMALEKLSEKDIVQLDEERKAAMVSNLLVVLCGERNVAPVVNAGTLYH
ncbi:Regulator of protease activity HflC, stomatin/prohibitin superfamily [Parapedobacter luteus]|uniref:Regulator of protease activity HflC, stomatin/prohibitin superfamily n=1 Tax=Parapedobacter luteus TaxID=623280 RepID=A0A1T5CEJ9_9SPHI|nr:SPFH domain-containing protein [Parapedobacter luteus]SKB57952.1 Regulator of protease activity HflC, stomatin/prohibitin superfamily [Parapedobacter luteus]